MYKEYSADDYLQVADECSARIKGILQIRYDELEELRDAINDRYPFADLFRKYAEVDYEEALIWNLLKHLEKCTADLKDAIRRGER